MPIKMICSKWMSLLTPYSRIMMVKSFSFQATDLEPIEMTFNEYRCPENRTPLVIMHGLFGSKANWQSLSKSFCRSTKRKVFAVDARNHGNSPHSDEFSYELLAEDIKYFVESQNLDQICLMGHSMGGRAAMMFALKFENYVEKLIVVDISPIAYRHDMTLMRRYFVAMKSVKIDNNLPTSEGRRLADKQLKPIISEKSVRSFLLTNLVKSEDGVFYWRLNLDVLERNFLSNIMTFDIPDVECHKPTLFIGGLKSSYLQSEEESEILDIFPNSEFVYLNTGHWVHAEDPSTFMSVVQKFLMK